MMGLGESTKRNYLTIGYGRIRKKCGSSDPKAIERKTKKGDTIYAIEYNFIDGTLENIIFKDDPEYGKSWTLQITDGEVHYAVQIPEASRYATDLLKKVPNLHKGLIYKFTPYDFEDLNAKKRRIGLSIKTPNDKKIDSYYQKFTEKDGKNICENLHGFPEFKGNSKDSDELKIYFMQVIKFLRTKALEYISTEFLNQSIVDDIPPEEPEVTAPDDGDLPF
jgi:hypothetical protein